MNLIKLIFRSVDFKNIVSFLLIFFFKKNLLFTKAHENKYLIRNKQEENKLKEYYFQDATIYSNHNKLGKQLKMFFGFDAGDPETSFYPELLIIEHSDSVCDMYKLKLNEMSIKK